MKEKKIAFEITTSTLFKVAFFLIAVFFIWHLRAVFFMLFLAFIIYSAFDPIVDYLVKKRIPRSFAILVIYFFMFVFLSLVTVVGVNALIDQYNNLSSDIDEIIISFVDNLERVFPWLDGQIDSQKITEDLTQGDAFTEGLFSSNLINDAFGVLSSVTSFVLSAFVVVMVSIYMLDRQEKFYLPLINYLPKNQQELAKKLMKKIEVGLGGWAKGELVLMLTIGVVTWVVIMLPGLFFDNYTLDQYALPIALIAGLLEAVPNIGPTITAIIAVIIAIGSAGIANGDATVIMALQSLYVVITGFVIQNLEAVFLVPKIMKRAVGVDPIVTILGIIAALSMFGIIGALLVIPVIATVQIAFNFFREEGII